MAAAVSFTSERLPLLHSDSEFDSNKVCYYNAHSTNDQLDYTTPDLICVFVVAFDTRAGNIIEWSTPEDVDLEGVEFKAIPSGSHSIENDLVYFRKGKWYGVACFHNVKVNSEVERGARMKSVGILATSCTNIQFYNKFLQSQIRNVVNGVGNYEELSKFYKEHKGGGFSGVERSAGFSVPPTNQFTKQDETCFGCFVGDLKEQLLVLWKAVLMRKRILVFTQPPIQKSCQRVYCMNALSFHSVPELADVQPISIFFYINVTDMDAIDCSTAYIACTTDRILESKPLLSDVTVSNDFQVQFKEQHLHDVIAITRHDRHRYHQLAHIFGLAESGFDDFTKFVHFFCEQNTLILGTLLTISSSAEKVVTRRHVNEMRLDFHRDRKFLQRLVQIYDFNLSIEPESSCCSACCC